MKERPVLAVYYFPEYHPDPRNAVWHGKSWSEWELVRRAEPKFPGHRQPKMPLWGYEDESDPGVMARKIAAAADHGLDIFIFDWYWYEDGPFLQRCLEEGFLKAENNDRLGFALMWANHDWHNQHPGHRHRPSPLLAPGKVSRKGFDEAARHVVETCFPHPSYWHVGGRLYFSFYAVATLVEGLGGVEETRDALEGFRELARSAGLGEIHFNAVQQGTPIDTGPEEFERFDRDIRSMGFDSVTAYIWHWKRLFARFPVTEYAEARGKSVEDWAKYAARYSLPYFPNVTMGWDNSPRTVQSDEWGYFGGVYTPVVVNNTPAEFEKALVAAREFLAGRPPEGRILTVNAWNEWTESSYLEPDTEHGFAYLEAIERVFGGRRGA